jgi:two-component system, OmpR family, response regulator VicR
MGVHPIMSTESIIVYIEDDSEIANLVELILKKEGFIVKLAFDGQSGLELIQSEKPDLILLDLMIPIIDGWDICKYIHNSGELRDTPIIILTAKAQEIDRVLGMHIAKVNDFICKPFHPNDLIQHIRGVLKK